MKIVEKTPVANIETWLKPQQVFDGRTLHSSKVVGLANDRVVYVGNAQDIPDDVHAITLEGTLSRGFFDIQVNGGGNALVNADPTPETLKTIARAHRNYCTTALFPTVITDRAEVIEAAADAVIATLGNEGIMGLHIEGPHISRARKGTHEEKYLRPVDADTLRIIENLRKEAVPVLITVAPEAATPRDVQALVAMGAVVSIGHSDAGASETVALLDAGASCFTHLFNAMSPMLNRAPGVTGTAINSMAYCSIIADGIHVAEQMLALAIRARPQADRMILISDAMPTVGGNDSFELYGRAVHLQQGRLINTEGTLAGAHTTMAEGLARLVNELGVDLEQVLRMSLANPARLMGLEDDLALMGAHKDELIVIDEAVRCRLLSS